VLSVYLSISPDVAFVKDGRRYGQIVASVRATGHSVMNDWGWVTVSRTGGTERRVKPEDRRQLIAECDLFLVVLGWIHTVDKELGTDVVEWEYRQARQLGRRVAAVLTDDDPKPGGGLLDAALTGFTRALIGGARMATLRDEIRSSVPLATCGLDDEERLGSAVAAAVRSATAAAIRAAHDAGPTTGLRLFYSYSREDASYLHALERALRPLVREGFVRPWHDAEILPGERWEGAILRELEMAEVVLLLISPDFLGSDFCSRVELPRALAREQSGEAIVVPILVRPVGDLNRYAFARLGALPPGAKPISKWADPDDACASIVEKLRPRLQSRAEAAPG
jgi:TIR domain